MPWWLAAFAAVLLAGSAWAAGPVRLYVARDVRCTDAERSLFSSGVRRAQVRVMNIGTATVFVGQADGTLTTGNGYPIHAGAVLAGTAHALILTNTSAGMNCVTGADTVNVRVLEEIE